MKENKQKNKGFTLIELMVATSIFVIIMLASMGALFTLLDAAKSSRALRSAMDNVNFAMESMTRSIRMGTNYYCVSSGQNIDMNDLDITRDCLVTDNGTFIAFVPQPQENIPADSRVGYKWSTTTINGVSHSTLERCDPSCVSIVSGDVNIEKLKFFVKGSAVDDKIQASVYIIMKGTVTTKNGSVSFSLQTMASQRNF